MIGGALLGLPLQDGYAWARRRMRRQDETLERAFLESYLRSVDALARAAARRTKDPGERKEIRRRCDALRKDAAAILGLDKSTPGADSPQSMSDPPQAGAVEGGDRTALLGFVSQVRDTLLDRLLAQPRWLGDEAPALLVELAREQLVAGLLAAFRAHVTGNPTLYRRLMWDATVLQGEPLDSAGSTPSLADFGRRLDALVSECAGDLGELELALAEVQSGMQELRSGMDLLLTQLHLEQAQRLPLPRRFRGFVAEKSRHFVGRGHVYRELDRFMSDNPSGYFSVRADPGMGKSAIVANYTRRTQCLAYFNQRASGLTRASQFLESVCNQLVERFRLEVAVPERAVELDGGTLSELLDESQAGLGDEPLVIVVDALDEVDLTSQDRSANVLYLPSHLPEGVFFFLTQRDVPCQLVVDVPSYTLNLTEPRFQDDNLADARDYLERSAYRNSVAHWITSHGTTREAFVERLVQCSEGNFMYLHHALADIVAHRWSPATLPIGLQSYYTSHWRLMGMDASPLPSKKLKILYILLEYQEPISVGLLAQIAREAAAEVNGVLQEWREFLRRESIDREWRYSLYHESFADFLRSHETLAASRMDLSTINDLIATRLIRDFHGDP